MNKLVTFHIVNEIVECINNEDLKRTIKTGQQFENVSTIGQVTINSNGWWSFPTYHRWKVVSPKAVRVLIKGPCGHYH